jgi:glycolate oxidase
VASAAPHRESRVTRAHLDALRRIAGDDHVLAGDADVEPFARDATPLFRARPDAVVLPGSTEEVAAIMRLATAERIPVVPRGAGTNLAAATIAEQGGIVLVLTRLNRILEVSADELLLRAQAGATTAAVANAAAAVGLCYPPDPGSHTVSTIGGNVAMCAGGLRGLKYGVTRNYVLGCEAVLATGEMIRTGGRLWKDVAGYDLTRLLTGSEGTLAVVTEVTVALLPAQEVALTGLAWFESLADAGRAVAAIIRSGTLPATLEFLDRTCINAVEDYANLGLQRDAGALLLFGDDGSSDAVRVSLASMASVCMATGARSVDTASDAAGSADLLAARRCSLPALARLAPATMLEDVGVPRPQLATMVSDIEAIAADLGVRCATFGHAGDGNLHPTIVFDPRDADAKARALAAADRIFARALELGGTLTGEHGIGAAKLPWLERRLGADQVALLRRIKTAFDPAGILNPGKLGS